MDHKNDGHFTSPGATLERPLLSLTQNRQRAVSSKRHAGLARDVSSRNFVELKKKLHRSDTIFRGGYRHDVRLGNYETIKKFKELIKLHNKNSLTFTYLDDLIFALCYYYQ